MIELGEHSEFIIAAYVVVTLVVAGLILTTILRNRAAKARLSALEASSDRARSAQSVSDPS